MTTTSNPSGSPVVAYNNSGTTIDTITGSGITQGSATPIVRYGGNTIVLASRGSGGGSDTAVILPSDAEVGDVVQVVAVQGFSNSIDLFPPSGEQIWTQGTNNSFTVAGSSVFRKMTSNLWF